MASETAQTLQAAPAAAKPRIVSVDIAKAIAIIFIVIGHAGLVFGDAVWPGGMPYSIVHFAFTFHLPVFFVASGYFFKASQKLDAAFLKKGLKSLILPYIVTGAFVVIVLSVMAFFSEEQSARVEFMRWLGAVLYGEGSTTDKSLFPVERIGAIWFLLALFWGQIILVVTDKLPFTNVWVIGLFLLAWWSSDIVWLPWSIQSGFGAALFMRVGIEMRKHDILAGGKLKWPIVLICLAAWFVYFHYTVIGPSYAMLDFPVGIFDPIGGLAASLVVFRLSEFIGAYLGVVSTAMQAIGRNTLAMFSLHLIEDNCIQWWQIMPWLSDTFGAFAWVVFLVFRFATIAALMGVAFVIPPLRRVYFPRSGATAKK